MGVGGGGGEPHPWHVRAAWREAPHSRQNFASAGPSSLHDGQRIAYPHTTSYTLCCPLSPFSSTLRPSPNVRPTALSVSSLSSDDTRISPPCAWPAMRAARITAFP